MKKNTIVFLIICAVFSVCTTIHAQVNITFTGGSGSVINKYLFGVNVSANVPRLYNEAKTPTYPASGNPSNPWSADETFKPQYFPTAITDVGVSYMRYPGGHKTSYWHWDDIWYIPYVDLWGDYTDGGVSTRSSRKQPSKYGGNMDIDEYMTQCINLNLEPMIGCNLLAGSRFGKYSTRAASEYSSLPYGGDPVAETVAMLKYCKQKYPTKPINYIFLDNEVGHQTADGTINANSVSYAQYPQMVQDCSVAFKAESPNVKIITNHIAAANSAQTKNLIITKGDYIDLVDAHFYLCTGAWLEYSRSVWMKQTVDNLGGYPIQIRQFYSNCAAAGHPNIKLITNEWNLPSVGPLKIDAAGAKTYGATDFDQMLVMTDMLMMFVREKVEMASLWSLYYNKNATSMIIPQQNYNVRTPYFTMKLFKEIQGQATQNLTCDTTNMILMSALQNAESTAVGTTPKLILLLLSKSVSANRTVTVDLGCFKPKSVVGFSYVEDTTRITDPNNMDGRYKTLTLNPVISNGKIVVDCAGLSVSKLTVDLDMTPEEVDPTINHAPVATNVAINGTVSQGQTLTAIYKYVDMEADKQGTSTFRWLRSAKATFDASATVIPGATSKTYKIQVADSAKYLFFEVTPVALSGIISGTPVVSVTSSAVPVLTRVDTTVSKPSLKLYPSPAENLLYVEFKDVPNEYVNIELLSIDGKLIKKDHVASAGDIYKIDISQLQSGVYMCRVNNGTTTESAKFNVFK